MIQDIGEHKFHNEYCNAVPDQTDYVLSYKGNEALVRRLGGQDGWLTYGDVCKINPEKKDNYRYLFRIDDKKYFLIQGLNAEDYVGCTFEKTFFFREMNSLTERFAGITGYQLADWYESRKFCPRCGKPMVHDEKERMMRCPDCKLMEFPKICPAVIVAVTNGDKLLLTKYAGRGTSNYALIAGFTEIGETPEQTVVREVMEEVGLKVKNVRYYKSQPWSFTGVLLMGFYCDLDGDDTIRLDETELAMGAWLERDELPDNDGISLTREMIARFKENNFPA